MPEASRSAARGRRPGQSDTRQRILEVARRRFLAEGYQGVSLRAIATEAGVDAALPSYFFGSKQGLFGAAMALPINPADVLQAALALDLEGLPERALRGLMMSWGDDVGGPPLRAMASTAISDADTRRLVVEAVQRELIERLTERIGTPDAAQRAAAFSAVMAGLIFSRYLLGLEPMASMRADEVVERLVPVLRAALFPAEMSAGEPGS
jgi:AcrR family transcriptional regulator